MSDIPASCLIANPPYIPAPDNNILMPALHGGEDGANLTRVGSLLLLPLYFISHLLLINVIVHVVPLLHTDLRQPT